MWKGIEIDRTVLEKQITILLFSQIEIIQKSKQTTYRNLPIKQTLVPTMIFLRPSYYNPYSGPRAKIYFWQPSDEASSDGASTATEQTEHVAKKNKIEQGRIKASEEHRPTMLYQDQHAQIEDQDNELKMSIDCPGVKSNDISIEFENGRLSVVAERKSNSGQVAKHVQKFFVNEQTVDTNSISASVADGVLTITIPKKEEPKPFPISVMGEYPPEETDDDKALRFTMDLPGVKVDKVKLEYRNNKLTLQAERTRGHTTSSINKDFVLNRNSMADTEAFKAYLKDGVLTITGIKTTRTKKSVVVVPNNPIKTIKAMDINKKDEGIVVETVKGDE